MNETEADHPVSSSNLRALQPLNAGQGRDSDDELLVPATKFSIVDPDNELADSLHADLDWPARCTDLLRKRPQLIFYGPPGIGKTYTARTLARHLAGPDTRHQRRCSTRTTATRIPSMVSGEPAQQWSGRLRAETVAYTPLDRPCP